MHSSQEKRTIIRKHSSPFCIWWNYGKKKITIVRLLYQQSLAVLLFSLAAHPVFFFFFFSSLSGALFCCIAIFALWNWMSACPHGLLSFLLPTSITYLPHSLVAVVRRWRAHPSVGKLLMKFPASTDLLLKLSSLVNTKSLPNVFVCNLLGTKVRFVARLQDVAFHFCAAVSYYYHSWYSISSQDI